MQAVETPDRWHTTAAASFDVRSLLVRGEGWIFYKSRRKVSPDSARATPRGDSSMLTPATQNNGKETQTLNPCCNL